MATYPPLAFSRESSKSALNKGVKIRVISNDVRVDQIIPGQSYSVEITHEFISAAEKDEILALWAANKGTAITLVWPEDYQFSVASPTGEVQAASSTTVTLESGASAADDDYNGWWVQVAAHQYREVTDYVGAGRLATVSPAFDPTPTVGDDYGLHETLTSLTLYITGRPIEHNTSGGHWMITVVGVAE